MRRPYFILIVILLHIFAAICIVNELPSYDPVEPIPSIPTPGSPTDDTQYYELSQGWNMVSMPETMYKEGIFVTIPSTGETFNWSEAVTAGLIIDEIYNYANGAYNEVNQLLQTHGYWMYTFVDDLVIYNDPAVVICRYLNITDNESDGHINCSRVIITDMSNITVTCHSIYACDTWDFYYENQDTPSIGGTFHMQFDGQSEAAGVVQLDPNGTYDD